MEFAIKYKTEYIPFFPCFFPEEKILFVIKCVWLKSSKVFREKSKIKVPIIITHLFIHLLE